MTVRTPSEAEVLQLAVARAFARARTCLPARVESYDAAKQTCSARPLLLDSYATADGERVTQRLPIVTNCPVVFPGGGGYRTTFPLSPGDSVLLVFSDRSIDLWLERGGEVDPEDDRTHDLSDGIAIPGLHSSADVWTGASTNSATFGKNNGPQVEATASALKLGTSATQPLVRGTEWRTAEALLHANLITGLGALATAALGIIPPPTGIAIQAAAFQLIAAIQIYETTAGTPGVVLSLLSKTE